MTDPIAMPPIRSVPHLLAIASGLDCAGPQACLYCGAPCDGRYPASTHVKDSFTGRGGVVAPASRSVCQGCVIALREDATITLLDGEVREGQKTRGYSWVITATEARAATKAHLGRLRAICLDPPEPPFAIVLSDSGQTHQLYRGAVARSRDLLTVTLEAEPIAYRPEQLRSALGLAARIAAATGKPSLREPLGHNSAMRVLTYHGPDAEALIDAWHAIHASPIGRLAAWLCAPKEECARDHRGIAPSEDEHGDVPPKTGGVGRSEHASRGSRAGRGQGHSQSLLFDPRPPVL